MNKVISGVNDFPTTNPELLIQWDYEKNDIDPTKVSKGSDTKRWWLCEEFRHSHHVSVSSKTKKNPTKCTVCKGRQLLTGFNDLQTKYPDVASEWDYDRNDTTPDKVTSRNHNTYWWKCRNHPHSYKATCNDKTKPSRPGCPYCFGNKVLQGFNDVATTDPAVSKLMISPDPTLVSRGFSGMGEFTCEKVGHTYKCLVRDKFTHEISCPICYGRRTLDGFNSLKTTDPEILAEWDYDKNELTPEEVTRGSNKVVWFKCSGCGDSYQRNVYQRVITGQTCPKCIRSSGEQALLKYIKEVYSGEVISSDRTQIKPLELDIYIPDLKVAIEFNGLFYHSEYYKDRYYHRDKYLSCLEKGIQLIQIWEDDWRDNTDLVKSMISHKLGVSTAKRVFARNTYVEEINPKVSKAFLDQNHIQGSATGSIRIGLFEKVSKELVAVMVLKKSGTTLTLERFATSNHVVGGQSKLLKWVDLNVDYNEIVTFADLTISDGNLYESTGWIKDSVLRPDYKYLYRGSLHHKFGFRKHRFSKDQDLKFDPSMSESQLASLNKLYRVYDAGKIRYVRKNPTK